ncbi:hypothetical protein EDC01DRAFT_634145 [Geopyxis carbonaria]|nr:hypothetical protein EDC01DRAFT_634145 [Geopyxis carbonaria]
MEEGPVQRVPLWQISEHAKQSRYPLHVGWGLSMTKEESDDFAVRAAAKRRELGIFDNALMGATAEESCPRLAPGRSNGMTVAAQAANPEVANPEADEAYLQSLAIQRAEVEAYNALQVQVVRAQANVPAAPQIEVQSEPTNVQSEPKGHRRFKTARKLYKKFFLCFGSNWVAGKKFSRFMPFRLLLFNFFTKLYIKANSLHQTIQRIPSDITQIRMLQFAKTACIALPARYTSGVSFLGAPTGVEWRVSKSSMSKLGQSSTSLTPGDPRTPRILIMFTGYNATKCSLSIATITHKAQACLLGRSSLRSIKRRWE